MKRIILISVVVLIAIAVGLFFLRGALSDSSADCETMKIELNDEEFLLGDTVKFSSNQPNATQWLWDMGDNATFTSASGAYAYNAPGTYTVTLIVDGDCQVTRKLVVFGESATEPEPTAETEEPEPGKPYTPVRKKGPTILAAASAELNKPIQFKSTAKDAKSYAWDFNGDGVIDSREESPSHTYTSAANYTVSLEVNGDGLIGMKRVKVAAPPVAKSNLPNKDAVKSSLMKIAKGGFAQYYQPLVNSLGGPNLPVQIKGSDKNLTLFQYCSGPLDINGAKIQIQDVQYQMDGEGKLAGLIITQKMN